MNPGVTGSIPVVDTIALISNTDYVEKLKKRAIKAVCTLVYLPSEPTNSCIILGFFGMLKI